MQFCGAIPRRGPACGVDSLWPPHSKRIIMYRILWTSLLGFALSLEGVTVARAEKLVLLAGGGNGTAGGPATEAKLQGPFGIDCDKAGNFYIVEMIGQRVHKEDAKGNLNTIAGI